MIDSIKKYRNKDPSGTIDIIITTITALTITDVYNKLFQKLFVKPIIFPVVTFNNYKMSLIFIMYSFKITICFFQHAL